MSFDSDYLSIVLDEDIIILNWKRTPSDEELRFGLEKGLEIVSENQIKKWLANTKLIGEIPPLLNDWINFEWFPRCLVHIEKMAIIIPSSALALLSVNQIMRRVGKLETKYFDSVEKAKSWL
jgi:hypothetical protein